MRTVTLVFLRQPGHICLAMKKRGFGVGKWNGVGGKLEPGETIQEAAIRETHEEIGVTPTSLEHVAEIAFFFTHMPQFNQTMHVFMADTWTGEPTETEEMAPRWYPLDQIPFGQMWPDDPHWLPRVLAGERIRGSFTFNTGDVIEHFSVELLHETALRNT